MNKETIFKWQELWEGLCVSKVDKEDNFNWKLSCLKEHENERQYIYLDQISLIYYIMYE